jgi:oligosaccharyltransferase complex subunit delta (ribophorin II)
VDSAKRQEDDKVLLTKKQLNPVPGDSTSYTFNLMESKPSRGLYELAVSGVPSKADPRLIGNKGALLVVKVMTEITVKGAEIGTVELDQTSPPKLTKVDYPGKLAVSLEADHHQKIIIKFTLHDKNAAEAMTAHQTFVCLTNVKNQQEIIFVVESDASNNYRFDMDVNGRAKDFNFQSGKYKLQLIVGDAVISNPFSWTLGELELSFPEGQVPPTSDKLSAYLIKPEIKHLFREPDKRPSSLVSNAFTALTILPLFLLLILWVKIGINISNFKFNLGTIGFHSGLAAIFALLVCFWLKLNMFSTLKYLLGLGIVTFLSGNSMLSKMAQHRKH